MDRQMLAGALGKARKLFINGVWTEPAGSGVFDVFDSATEELVLKVAAAGPDDVADAVGAARTAFDDGPWPGLAPQARGEYLRAIARGWRTRGEVLADSWSAESGVLRSTSAHIGEIGAQVFEYYAGITETYAWREEHVSADGLPSLLVREPVGVVAAIIPWNGPAIMIAYKVAAALISGCTVIVKASPEAPSAALLLGEICEEAELPPGVVNVLVADREISELLVRDPRVDKISFTGSTAAGRRIGAICAERIARCTLELGGKSPALILDDYDVAAAAQSIATSAIAITGQVCSSLTRIIVNRRRHDDLIDALVERFAAVHVGDPFDSDTQMGPLVSAHHRARVEDCIARARSEGGRLAVGGGRPAHLARGYYVEPTVFADVENAASIAQEEVFGPVICVIAAEDDDDAVRIANDTIYGLNSTIFTHDADRAYALGRRIRAGTVGHNGFKSDATIAFGGFKQSGIGREGGLEGLLPFLEAKSMIFAERPRAMD